MMQKFTSLSFSWRDPDYTWLGKHGSCIKCVPHLSGYELQQSIKKITKITIKKQIGTTSR